jgi:peptidoglycan/xylan/chitin deacetylase (PgdA/CDA1 family)
MSSYWVKTPWWVKRFFSKELVWNMPQKGEPTVYITFDDGPHPVATPFALAELKRYDAKATFFCIGKNVSEHQDIYNKMLAAGHTPGNHTQNHLNGWYTETKAYLSNILQASKYVESSCFRPPYGKIKLSQVRVLHRKHPEVKIYMWDVLSGDFDQSLTPEQCAQNVLENIEPGSIVVFHDSEKAWERMSYALPLVLQHCKKRNWKLEALPLN